MDVSTALKAREQAIEQAAQREVELGRSHAQEDREILNVAAKLDELVKLIKDTDKMRHFIMSAGGEAVLIRPDFSQEHSKTWLTISAYGTLRYIHVVGACAGALTASPSDIYFIVGEDSTKYGRIVEQVQNMVRSHEITAAQIQNTFEEWLQLVIDFTNNQYQPYLHFRDLYKAMAAETNPKLYGWLIKEKE